MRLFLCVVLMGVCGGAFGAPFRHLHYVLPDPFQFEAGTVTEPISEHSLQWPLLLRDYLWYEGDEAYVRALTEGHLDALLDRAAKHAGEDGLIPEGADVFEPAGGAPLPHALVNAFYIHSLRTAADLLDDLGRNGTFHRVRADGIARSFRSQFVDAATGLVKDDSQSGTYSIETNAAAICFGVAGEVNSTAFVKLVRERGPNVAPGFDVFVIEALFRIGETPLAMELLAEMDRKHAPCADRIRDDYFHWCAPTSPSHHYLVAEYVFGLRPLEPGWKSFAFEPTLAAKEFGRGFEVPAAGGRISIARRDGIGFQLTAPIGSRVVLNQAEGENVVVNKTLSHTAGRLTPEHLGVLEKAGWDERVDGNVGIWISAGEQTLRIVRDDAVIFQARCATAANGLGSEMDSLKTPLGWHAVSKKIGGDAPWGQVFRSRVATREVWKPGDNVAEDMVLTRVILLDGLEPGVNKGGRVDSMARNIYIHGTNDEARIGMPSSHGCIRLLNDDVIDFFGRVDEGVLVLITAE